MILNKNHSITNELREIVNKILKCVVEIENQPTSQEKSGERAVDSELSKNLSNSLHVILDHVSRLRKLKPPIQYAKRDILGN